MNGFYITNLDDNFQGGLFNATYERIKRHTKSLKEVTIINNNFILRDEDKYVFNELNIINLNYKRSIGYIIDKFIYKRQEERLVRTYTSKFNTEISKADFIHAHWGWPNGYLAYKIAEIYSKPYFITFHGSDINNIKKRNIRNMLEAMESASSCFFVSNALLNSAINLGYSGKNAIVNYNGVDLSLFQLKITRNKTIGYAGTLNEKKGADFLPSIFKKINDLENCFNYKIIGNGTLKKEIYDRIKKVGLEKKVEFLGEVPKEKVATLLRGLDLLIIPSRMEGLGMVILEANACGVPVVGSDRGGIPEAIGEKWNCFSIDNNFINNISKRACEILSDTNNKKNSIKLRDRVEALFTWERVVEVELIQYNKAIKSAD